ncbi:MAG: S1 RNA-binding domain-containing protein [Oscillospiraceae bacterium]|nr:S1 RNA-binding domain-containing protein [Oscillospiraceae bacterium]
MKEYYPEGWFSEDKNTFTPTLLSQALQSESVLEADVLMCDSDHNLILNLGCMKGIIPREEGAIGILEGTTRDIALISRVGRPVSFIVDDIKTDNKGALYALLSRKKAQLYCKEHLINNRKPGDIINAKITHLESFGAFCDIGCGNIALLPIDSVSVSRISHPKDRFKTGDNIRVIIKDISPDGKITLSHKELLGTWEENSGLFSQGQTVTGVIRSVEEYGAFVELTPNLAGLAEPKPDIFIGQQASVYIKSIIPEKMKIKLIIIDNFDSNYTPKIKYFYNGENISRWQYSPEECYKKIYSVF